MYDSQLTLCITMCSVALFFYWLAWACLVIMTDVHLIDSILDREYQWLRGLLKSSTPGFFQWLDRHTITIWHRLNWPVCIGIDCDSNDDAISALGRFAFIAAEESGWFLVRNPKVSRPAPLARARIVYAVMPPPFPTSIRDAVRHGQPCDVIDGLEEVGVDAPIGAAKDKSGLGYQAQGSCERERDCNGVPRY